MQITYELSGRQRKELIERGRRLWIALPAPTADDGYDPMAFARESLPTLDREWFRSAERDSAPIDLEKSPHDAGGLMNVIGQIVPPDKLGELWHVYVLIVSVELLVDRPRQSDSLLAWPGGAITRDAGTTAGEQIAEGLEGLRDSLRAGGPIEVTRVRRDERGQIKRFKGRAK